MSLSLSRAAAPRTSLSTNTNSDARHEGLVPRFPVASLAGRLVRVVRRAVLPVCRCPRERRCGGGDKGGGGKTNCTRVREASLFSALSSSHTQTPSLLATSHVQRSAQRTVHSSAARECVLYFCSSVELILAASFPQCGAASAEETSQAVRPAPPMPSQLYLQHVCVCVRERERERERECACMRLCVILACVCVCMCMCMCVCARAFEHKFV